MDPPIKIGRFRKNRLGRPNNKTVIFCRCSGMIRTQRWRQSGSGSGQLSDAREGGCGLTREVRLDLAVGSELCRKSRAERREEREARRLFPETENVRRKDRLYCRYSYQLGHQTNSEWDETGQAVYLHYNKTARQLSTHSENIFWPLIK